jgi:hypothetical protein
MEMGNVKKTGKRIPDTGKNPRQITTIHFVDQHQDFTSWDLDEKGVVIACRPFQGWVWCHRRVLNFDKLRVGEFAVISPLKGKRGKPATIIHPIERITTQLVKEAA